MQSTVGPVANEESINDHNTHVHLALAQKIEKRFLFVIHLILCRFVLVI